MTPARKMQLLFAACSMAALGVVSSEGWVLKGYPDPVHGPKVPTACAGVTEGIVLGQVYSADECVQKTMIAMVQNAGPIAACMPDDMPATLVPYLKTQVNTAFNIGGPIAYRKSTMCRLMKAGDYYGSCEAILLYKRAGKVDCSTPGNKVCGGLWTRRLEQRAECVAALTP